MPQHHDPGAGDEFARERDLVAQLELEDAYRHGGVNAMLELLQEKHVAYIFQLIKRHTREAANPADLQDIYQNVMLTLLEHINYKQDKFDPTLIFRLVYVIARSRSYDFLRGKKYALLPDDELAANRGEDEFEQAKVDFKDYLLGQTVKLKFTKRDRMLAALILDLVDKLDQDGKIYERLAEEHSKLRGSLPQPPRAMKDAFFRIIRKYFERSDESLYDIIKHYFFSRERY
jgi:DNA-directed RNA polymerase specialized sigma24 family protein